MYKFLSFNCVHLDTCVKSAYKVSSVYCIKCKLHVRKHVLHTNDCRSIKMVYNILVVNSVQNVL